MVVITANKIAIRQRTATNVSYLELIECLSLRSVHGGCLRDEKTASDSATSIAPNTRSNKPLFSLRRLVIASLDTVRATNTYQMASITAAVVAIVSCAASVAFGWMNWLKSAAIWVLGVFSPNIHAARLHFVEWMRQFYTASGRAFTPLGGRSQFVEVDSGQ